jgi:uncharacterized membrane protein YhaH (DUF805 family)
MNTILKGLLMTVLVFIATTIQTSGMPATSVAWSVLGITTLGTILVYVAQSFALPTTSTNGTMNWLDIGKGAIIAVGNMLATFGADAMTNTTIDWKALIASMGAILLGYFVKQLATVPTGIPPTK